MGDIVRDRSFGQMEYKHGWVKIQEAALLGKKWQVKIMAAAYTGEKICEEQRMGYRYFSEHNSKISEQCEEAICGYVKSNSQELSTKFPFIKDIAKSNLAGFVKPRTTLFARDGSVIILFDSKWDEENGIGVKVYPDVKVEQQDAFL